MRLKEWVSEVFSTLRRFRNREEAAGTTLAQSRLDAYLTHSPDGVILLDLDGLIVEVNARVQAMLAYEAAELVGCSMEVLLPESSYRRHRARVTAMVEEGRPLVCEECMIRQGGGELPLECHLALVQDASGAPHYIQVLLRDLSLQKAGDVERGDLLENLRKRTRQIQTAFEVSKSISSTLDFNKLLSQTVEIIKQRFEFYYVGLFLVQGRQAVLAAGSGEPGRAMMAAGHSLAVGPSSMVGWCIENQQARIALDVGQDPVRFDNPLTPKTRSELAMPLIHQGQAIGALTVQSEYPAAFNSEDVAILQIMADQLAIAVQNARLLEQLSSYAGELEVRVQERTGQLEEVNRELEAFSYSISHDLRTPLRAIHGYSNIVLETADAEVSENVRGYLDKIKANALRMNRLIDDILALSRMGRQALRITTVAPERLVAEVLEDLSGALSDHGFDLYVDPLPPIKADPVLLKQVFANLIGNAVKFTKQEAQPAIQIRCTEGTQGQVVFSVSDNGVGFDMRYANRLFGVFQRLHHVDEFEGTGVGLAIVKRVVQRHGGEVWVEAAPGEGATFYFSLPAGRSG